LGRHEPVCHRAHMLRHLERSTVSVKGSPRTVPTPALPAIPEEASSPMSIGRGPGRTDSKALYGPRHATKGRRKARCGCMKVLRSSILALGAQISAHHHDKRTNPGMHTPPPRCPPRTHPFTPPPPPPPKQETNNISMTGTGRNHRHRVFGRTKTYLWRDDVYGNVEGAMEGWNNTLK